MKCRKTHNANKTKANKTHGKTKNKERKSKIIRKR